MATINTTSPSDLRNLLNNSIALIAITFIKLDGSERTIIGSTNPVYVPAEDKPKTSTISNDLNVKKTAEQENTITLYEVMEGQWRSLKYDRITKVEVAEVQPELGLYVEDDGKTFDFGSAVEYMKLGHRVARSGWNGKNMFVYLEYGNVAFDTVVENKNIGGVALSLFRAGDYGTVTRMPYICMRAADGSTVVGWLASQTDMLAEDWNLIE